MVKNSINEMEQKFTRMLQSTSAGGIKYTGNSDTAKI